MKEPGVSVATGDTQIDDDVVFGVDRCKSPLSDRRLWAPMSPVAAWLLSDRTSMVTGAIVRVDEGAGA